jgi:2-keto-4-pentenoate hydratase/2-oxohepta-3-ene-1,7-dioic acid hydratase in catechol pathway
VRIVRFDHRGRVAHGVLDGDTVDVLAGRPHDPLHSTGQRVPLDEVRLLAPVTPGLLVGMARNTGPADRALPPRSFLKPPGSVIGPRDPIPVPAGIGRVDAEAELAVVIGRTARGLTGADALRVVLGYTVANDVTARDLQQCDPLWTQAKGYDGFTPVGPWIDTRFDADAADVVLLVGDEQVRGNTADLGRGVAEILVHLTSFLTLHPGDVVLTGAPGTFASITPGDLVTASVEGLGTLSNPAEELA